ncbi:hypothetical protein ACJRO7_020379 [Eucalyptus globulus]|uniref:PGG domain-containing protein n=1 Tax=Eucalyptus globulus TaxID=34317 RepID=A0ABD3KI19_EUCGL
MANAPESPMKLIKVFFNHYGHDFTIEVRNVLLVVATLIIAITFQAGVRPPAIYASQYGLFNVFLVCNTLALSSSIYLIISLNQGFPFFLKVMVATVSMAVTYSSAVFAVTPNSPEQFQDWSSPAWCRVY